MIIANNFLGRLGNKMFQYLVGGGLIYQTQKRYITQYLKVAYGL
jgi:hypothetical protein